MELRVPAGLADLKREYGRQLEHWRLAAVRLGDLDAVAAAHAWQGLEHYLGVALRQTLTEMVTRVLRTAETVAGQLRTVQTAQDLAGVRKGLLDLRRAYTRAETGVEFYTDALASRAVPRMAALLRACDYIATRSLTEALTPLGRHVPAALTYLDGGMGASILKAGLRLWDGTAESPVCTIKVVRHNLFRPTAVLHEAGHQFAFSLGWTDELAAALRGVSGGTQLGETWSSWASEIAADAFALVHSGYASVAALHDVIDGSDSAVFQILPGDPHPVAFLRLLLGVESSRLLYGAGPWDALAESWLTNHPLRRAPASVRDFFQDSLNAMPRIAGLVFMRPYRAFGGRPLTAVVNPQRVSPAALERLERAAGAAAFTSPFWLWNEAIRLLALTGYRAAAGAAALREATAQQEQWMLKLGALRMAA